MMATNQIKETLNHLTREELLELVAELVLAQEENRKELDTLKGIIR